VALRAFIKEFERTTQISVELSADGIPKKLPAEIASCAYRVTQEALRNVTKHSSATRAEVILWIDANCLMLLIRDEGIGFDLASARSKEGIGLIGIEERVRLVGGTVMIETAEDCGTSVRVCLPLSVAA
jgi:two-component system NarL family sensor kinase